MAGFKRRGKTSRSDLNFVLKSLGVFGLLCIALLSAHAAWNMYERFASASEEATVAKDDLSTLQTQEAQVQVAVQNLSTDRGVEAQVRERYGVAKPGEGEIQIVHSATSSDATAPVSEGNVVMRLLKALFVW